MFILCRICFLLCLFAIGSTEFRDLDVPQCSNNATCLQFGECEALASAFTRSSGAPALLIPLAKALHCGFDEHSQPMICCPQILRERLYNPTRSPPSADAALDTDTEASLALLPAPGTCGVANDDRIYGGELTALDEHPWLALIGYSKRAQVVGGGKDGDWEATRNEESNRFVFASGAFSGFFCGGVLISSRYVLTAAHCVEGDELHGSRVTHVRLGEWNKTTDIDCLADDCNEEPLDVLVQQAIVHEAYSAAHEHQADDIALLRLQNDVPFTDFIKPICLPASAEQRREVYEGTAEVAGWGKTETRSSSPVKLKVSLPIVSNSICARIYKMASRDITERQMCAGGVSYKDSCRGDSGGPLMAQDSTMNWVVVGVVSYGPSPCGALGWPGVYTRVTAYVDWILSQLRP